MLDFNSAGPQKELGSKAVIPPKSIVMCKVAIQQPKPESVSPDDSCISIKKETGNGSIGLKYTVVAGRFEGTTFFGNHVVSGAETATAISMSFLRAMVEAGRNIQPLDASPQACEGRKIQAWFDLEELTFPLQVGIKKIQSGDKFINNEPLKIITPDLEQYPIMMLDGEIITDEPIPTLPATPLQPTGAPAQKAPWSNPVQSTTTPPTTPAPTQNTPKWAQKK